MKVRSSFPAAAIYIGAAVVVNGLVLDLSIAQESSKLPFSFEVDLEIRDPATQPLVFVNGELAGTLNGYIAIPRDEESVVEIGIPSASRPLYSFIIGTEEIEAGNFDFVFSDYSMHSAGSEVWSNVIIEPNQLGNADIYQTATGVFGVSLPAGPYEAYQNILLEGGVEPFGSEWLEAIPAQNDRSAVMGVEHFYATSQPEMWSGAALDLARQSWGGGMGRRWKTWDIETTPAQARIITQLQDHGYTNKQINLPDVVETYVVLQREGYFECSLPSNAPTCDCDRRDSESEVKLSCKLAEIP